VQPPSSPDKPDGVDSAQRVRVLIADDDPFVRGVIAGMLAGDSSLEVVGEASNADEALALTLEHDPHVVILDWMMPKGGGPAAARAITAQRPETALVALTSSDTQEASVDMLRAGAKSLLVKGGSKEELVRTIHGALTL